MQHDSTSGTSRMNRPANLFPMDGKIYHIIDSKMYHTIQETVVSIGLSHSYKQISCQKEFNLSSSTKILGGNPDLSMVIVSII